MAGFLTVDVFPNGEHLDALKAFFWKNFLGQKLSINRAIQIHTQSFLRTKNQ